MGAPDFQLATQNAKPETSLLAPSIVFVDLETTGANPVHGRVIEVGIVKVTDGRLDFEWSSLVDPGEPIPSMIQGITGITDAMVRGAPCFGQIAGEVRDLLEGSLFVAHNARFDYGFLKNEFRRLGMPFQPRVLCTVKLSRALYREHHKHGLDAVIARHNLSCDARHRALGDARVLWDFVRLIQAEKSPEEIAAAMTKAMKTPTLPSGLERAVLDAVPEGPGVYLFYGENSQAPGGSIEPPLYIGKGVNMRARAQSHFAADHSGGRAMRIAQEVKRIEWVETAGELGALLMEARLVKEKSPIHNRRLRRNDELSVLKVSTWPFPGRIAIREHNPELDRTDWHLFESWCYLGTARNEAELHEALHARHSSAFDLDTYRILKRALEQRPASLEIVRLQPA